MTIETAHRTYLDYNATAPMRPECIDAMNACFLNPSNPSSIHSEGRKARAGVENIRRKIAMFVSQPQAMVVFTSGATEAIQLALDPALKHEASAVTTWQLFTSPVEHQAALSGGRFSKDAMSVLKVNNQGIIDLIDLEDRLAAFHEAKDINSGAIISVQYANSETGVIQPIKEIAIIAHKYECLFHCDAVQGFGREPIDMSDLDIDMMSVSAHKMGGPLGLGALICKNDHIRPTPLLKGGGQERGMRGGTENTPAIIGFGAAIDAIIFEQTSVGLKKLRHDFEADLKRDINNLAIIAEDAERLPGTTAMAIPDISANSMLMQLDLMGVSASAGSACSSGKVSRSHVLKSMQIDDDLSGCVIRISGGYATTKKDYAIAHEMIVSIAKKNKPTLKNTNLAANSMAQLA